MQPGRTVEQRAEQRHYPGYAQDLRERFQSGMLSELTPFPHFVVWKYTLEQGKLKKRPFNPKNQRPAKTNDPSTWGNVEPALKALATGRFNGIGFVFSASDPFTGIDLDSCVSKDGTITPWAQEIITSLSSYSEYSPSKLGIHILTQATLEGAGRKVGNIEMYSQERFFTLTTEHIDGTSTTIAERQEAVAALYQRIAPPVEVRAYQNTRLGVGSGAGVTQLPAEAANDPVLQRLLQGDMSAYGNDQSRADFVLIMKLLHWTGDNIPLTRELFLASPLGKRPKAERPTGETTYVDMTIHNALRKRRNPPQRR